GQIARDYLAKRRVPADAVKLFRLGYAPDLWDDTVNWAKSKGHDLALVEQGGLIIKKDDRYYDRFRGRLMFPICDEQGRVIGFSGRVLSGDEKTAKYVNSPETPVFTKGKVFYGLDKSKRAILDKQFAIICEGQLDLIACFQAGVQNIVAPQGTALTTGHTRILKRYADEVVLCFDSDLAGQKAAIRSLDDLLNSGMSIRVATVPAPHDPDSFIKEFGGPAFQQLIDRAEGFFDFYLNYLCRTNDTGTDRGKLVVVRDLGAAVLKTGSSVLVDTYAQKTAHRLGVSVDSVRSEFRKSGATAKSPERREEEGAGLASAEGPPPPRPSEPEFWLLRLLFMNDDLVEWARHHLHAGWVQNAGVREMIQRRFNAFDADTWRGLAGLLDEIEDPHLRALLTEAVSEQRPVPEPANQLQLLVKRLRDAYLDRRIAELTRRASEAQVSTEEQVRIVGEQNALRQLKRQPLQPLGEA
ncbi:MAG TPA: toprim domain-containing protein, partial [Verrucomicrobiae bacterium]|nr:toprim domain-containing protein [Verrucomicrobiae bacterium]